MLLVPELLETLTDAWPTVAAIAHVTAASGVTVHAVLGRREVPAVIGWVGLAWLAPLIGSFFYLVFGVNRIRRTPVVPSDPMDYAGLDVELPTLTAGTLPPSILVTNPAFEGLARLGSLVTRRPLLPGNRVDALVDGDETYDAMLRAIGRAEHSVALQTYIFDSDRAGARFLEALTAAQARGVAVRVLVDAVGARYSRPNMAVRLHRAGVPVATFLSTLSPQFFRHVNLRNHRKILVVDGTVGFTGGMNIREGHQLSLRSASPVRCLHFRLEGPIVREMQRVFVDDWTFSRGEDLRGDARWFPRLGAAGSVLARGVSDGPDAALGNMPDMILGALSAAASRVSIVTPYFLPDVRILAALRTASLRGVLVNIIVPKRSNVFIMNWAMVPQMVELLEAGCHVWHTPPPFDHSKMFVVDRTWSLVGSTNWDARSLRLNFEYNVECYDATLAERLEALVEERIAAAEPVTLTRMRARRFPTRVRDGVARLLSPYL